MKKDNQLHEYTIEWNNERTGYHVIYKKCTPNHIEKLFKKCRNLETNKENHLIRIIELDKGIEIDFKKTPNYKQIFKENCIKQINKLQQ